MLEQVAQFLRWRRQARQFATVLLLGATAAGATAADAPTRNGFVLEPTAVPAAEIRAGGPGRDGIPALDAPRALSRTEAPWAGDEIVIGVLRGAEARAYPLALLNWHELVNDTLGGEPILVSFCPLCGTGMVFAREIDGKARRFGVSGLLYQSDMLLYDRETESLWSQIEARAVTGPALGQPLRVLRSTQTTWQRWQEQHPQTTVLGLDTGHRRDYARNPYEGYSVSPRLMFPAPSDDRFHPKMPTLGLRIRGSDGSLEAARGYPAAALVAAGGEVRERFAGREVRVAYDPDAQLFDVAAPPDVEVIEGFWFAWSAFHPDATIFEAAPQAGQAGGKASSQSHQAP